jgi:hypothetical protein
MYSLTHLSIYLFVYLFTLGWDSSVGIETRYELDGSGSNPGPSRPALGPTQPPVQWVSGLFSGEKRPGRGVDHLPSSSAEVKEE